MAEWYFFAHSPYSALSISRARAKYLWCQLAFSLVSSFLQHLKMQSIDSIVKMLLLKISNLWRKVNLYQKKCENYLVSSKKSSNFAPAFAQERIFADWIGSQTAVAVARFRVFFERLSKQDVVQDLWVN